MFPREIGVAISRSRRKADTAPSTPLRAAKVLGGLPSSGRRASDIADAVPNPPATASRLHEKLHALDGLAGTMEGIAAYLELNYPDDRRYMDVTQHLLDLSDDIFFLDEIWCESIGGTLFYCLPNDELIPTYSQNLGRGTIFPVNNGPVHTREAQNGANFLAGAFSAAGIPAR